MGMKVNKNQLSEVLGKSERTLTEWQKEGMPIEEIGDRGESNVYDTEKCIAWWFARETKSASSLENERAELTRLQQAEKRMNMAKAMGELVPAADIETTWTRFVIAARASALQLRWLLPEEITAAESLDAKRAIVDTHIEKLLRQLVAYEDNESETGEGTGELRPAGEDDDRGMGAAQANFVG